MRRLGISRILIGFFFSTSFSTSLASTTLAQSEGQLWLSASAQYDASDTFSIEFEQQLRVVDNFSRVGEILPQLSLKIRTTEWLRFAAGYRLVLEREHDESTFRIAHRVHADARVRFKFGNFVPHYRLRMQEKIWENKNETTRNRHTLRNRIGLQIRTGTRFRPNLSTENFLRIADEKESGFWKQRVSIGIDYRLGLHTVNVGYRLEASLSDTNELTAHALIIGYKVGK